MGVWGGEARTLDTATRRLTVRILSMFRKILKLFAHRVQALVKRRTRAHARGLTCWGQSWPCCSASRARPFLRKSAAGCGAAKASSRMASRARALDAGVRQRTTAVQIYRAVFEALLARCSAGGPAEIR